MDKKNYKYHVLLNMVQNKESSENIPNPLEFDFESHDDLFFIINWLQENQRFENIQETTEFAVGLKLLGGVMLKNKDTELFAEFFPAFVSFMKKLKGK